MMGSEDDGTDEKPIHKQCFDSAFWIDKYEVTQADFTRSGGQKSNPNYSTGEHLPVEKLPGLRPMTSVN